MKKFLSIYGIVLFLFVTYLFWDDMRYPYSFLYKIDYVPVIEKKLVPVHSLSPFLIFFIYIAVLVGIIISIKLKKSYVIATIGNLIISIPIFMVHKDTLFFEPFYFMYSYSQCIYIIGFVWYVYFSLLGVIMLSVYLFVNSNKRTARQRAAIKKIIKIGLTSISVVVVVYIAQCLYLSYKANYLIKLAYKNNGEYSQKLEYTISERNFKMLNDERNLDKEDNIKHYKNTIPISLVLFKQARSWYWYDGIKMNLYFPKIISFELKNFRWVITDVYEHP